MSHPVQMPDQFCPVAHSETRDSHSVHVLQAYLQDAQDLCIYKLLNLCVNLLIYHVWLVVTTILINMSSSMGRMTSHIYEMDNKIHV